MLQMWKIRKAKSTNTKRHGDSKMIGQKVLIAAPIGGWKQYSILDWFSWIARQNYPEELVTVCLCVNGKDNKAIAQQIRQTSIIFDNGFSLPLVVLELPESDELTTIAKITYSREMIRRYAVEKGFDYIFFLDTDTIPARADAISLLMEKKKDVISGLYFYKNTKQPVVIDALTNTNISLDICQSLALKQEICEVWGFGFGCLLISRKAFCDIVFDYGLFGEERTDDFGYCHALEQAGIKRFFSPFVICKHLSDPNIKKGDIGTSIPFLIKKA
jgi:hypothetical protein